MKTLNKGLLPFLFSLLLVISCGSPADESTPQASPRAGSAPAESGEADLLQPYYRTRPVIVAQGEWPPYTSAKLPGYGFDCRVVKEALALEGVETEFVFVPWNRALEKVRAGAYDASTLWNNTPEREEFLYFSSERTSRYFIKFAYDPTLLDSQGRPFQFQEADDLVGKRIGFVNNYYYGDLLEELQESEDVHFFPMGSDEIGLRKLIDGNIDLLPIDPLVATYLLHSSFSSRDVQHVDFDSAVLLHAGSHFVLSRAQPENADLMKIFDNGFRRLRESGRYQEIQDSYANYFSGGFPE